MKVALFVLTTFEDVFLKINDMRREQCRKHNIPVLFVYNGKVPDWYTMKDDEINHPLEGPAGCAMFVKSKLAITIFYDMFGFDPDYIVSCTSRCFVDLNKMMKVLESCPKERVAGGVLIGPQDAKYILGIYILFSRDVAKRFAAEDNVHGEVLWHSHDVTLSAAIKSYSDLYSLDDGYHCLTGYYLKNLSEADIPTELPVLDDSKWLFRIKNGEDVPTPVGQGMSVGEKIDVQYWKLCLKKYENITIA